jgi:hypothetical protein
MGQVQYRDGSAIHWASVELMSEETDHTVRPVQHTDKEGWFHFSWLPAGAYSVTVTYAGFKRFTLKTIQVSGDEQKRLPPLQLDVAPTCGPGPFIDYFQLLPTSQGAGNLSGRVAWGQERLAEDGPPIARAKVTLLCAERKVCGETRTDSKGEFLFSSLAPGEYTILVTHFGYYPLEDPGYEVREGFEQTYKPLLLEHCPNGNCDPRLRPKLPLIACQ